jgi:hypothetical protein
VEVCRYRLTPENEERYTVAAVTKSLLWRIQRTGTYPSGYVGKGDKCEALHADTPRAYPKIKGAACPSGTFASGDACEELR